MKQLLLFLMIALPSVARADDCGTCGNNLTYYYAESTKTLTISGSGAMNDYSNYSNFSPWKSYAGNILKVVIGNGVTSIGNYAFDDCSEIKIVVLPDGVTSIGRGAFRKCTNLSSVKMPQGLQTIGAYAFYSCKNLIEATIPNSVTSIGSDAFEYCKSLSRVILPNQLKKIENNTFEQCDVLETVVIPTGVTSIGKDAFSFCDRLSAVTIPNTVTSIGDDAFSCCSALKTVTIPNSVLTLGKGLVYNCVSLTSFVVPEKVTSIGDETFDNCDNLRSVTFPAGLKEIGNVVISSCEKLKEIKVLATTPPAATDNSFDKYTAILKVPYSALLTYQNTAPWNKFTITALTNDDLVVKKCAKPVISYANGEISFSCETPDVEFVYTIGSSGANIGSKASLVGNLLVTVFATKSGYEDSETVIGEFTPQGRQGDLDGDGKVNAADHVKLTNIIMTSAE